MFIRFQRLSVAVVLGLTSVLLAVEVRAESLPQVVANMLVSHDGLKAAHADLDASRARVKELFGDSWYPELSVTSDWGRQWRKQRDADNNSDLSYRETDFKLEQKVWDFGASNGSIEALRMQQKQMAATLVATRQALILDAVTTVLNFQRVNRVKDFAAQSVENIKRQGEVESAKVSLGKGYSTDVLQVKAQLTGAQARLVQALGAVAQVEDHVRYLFRRDPEALKSVDVVTAPAELLPGLMDECVIQAMEDNQLIKQLELAVLMLDAQAKSVWAGRFMPSLDGSVEHKMKKGVDGTAEFENETLLMVEFSLPINLGMSGLDASRAAQKDVDAAQNRLDAMRRQVEEQVRVAWHTLQTARKNAALLNDQANIAEKFLELAREERRMDKRTLLDVLNGETALINARSDAASAEADVEIAVYTLLQAMGKLELDIVK